MNTYTVHIWPDGSWVGEDDQQEFELMLMAKSDDFTTVEIPAEVDDIERWVDWYLDHQQAYLDYRRGL
jgi:hypothetical protein